ncbi:MAG: aryl-sulfate sulfotransferase [Bryobacteraceae bacterium]
MVKPLVLIFAIAVHSCAAAAAPMSVHLMTALPSPQPVGTPIGLITHVDEAAKGTLVYRYSVGTPGGPSHIIRDYSQQRDFAWMPALYEHDVTLRVTVRNNETKETAQDQQSFRIVSRIRNASSLVTPTFNPLIALFSSPPCPEGSKFRVAFQPEGGGDLNHTPLTPCVASRSNNVYVAGMRPDSEYRLRGEVVNGSDVAAGAWLPFHSGILDGDFPPVSIPVPRASGSRPPEPVLVLSIASAGGLKRPIATDLDGNIIWYLSSPQFLTRMLPGGRLMALSEGTNAGNEMRRLQILREMDLAGNSLRETNIVRVAEQLENRGIHSDCKKGGKECVSGFHHEAIRLPDGHTLVVAGLERILPAGTQGSKEPVDVLGDLVIDLDEDFQVKAVWNSFDHVDLKRASLEDAKCKEGPGAGGCPPIFLAAQANGWLHSNSLNYIPSTGDFLVSMPEQDWVLKIDWRNGKGSGKVLWRLGEGGDFAAKTSDPRPWFSYQHDAGFEPVGSDLLTILDDGHVRHKKDPKANTRGQVWKLDEQAHTATLLHNADLGVYAVAVGSAQALKDGGYSFECGFINPASVYSRAVETSPEGKVVYAQQVEGLIVYRSFRVADLYSAPTK